MVDTETDKVLIIGSGGREHAIGWNLEKSHTEKIYFAPGNAGTESIGSNIPIDAYDTSGLLAWAQKEKPILTFVGPEVPLASGIIDMFEDNDLSIFGPRKAAALLETSKSWATQFMDRYDIPHPQSHIFTDSSRALDFLHTHAWNGLVIKADGLAAGKGVIVSNSLHESEAAIRAMMIDRTFGDAGQTIVIQEKMNGPELSVLAFCDGKTAVPLLPAQDHKRIFDGDQGPNTGGMGSYAPVPHIDATLLDSIHRTILQPTIDGMRQEGHPFKGILFAGIMLTEQGPKVLEYNTRFGDPETQPLMMLLESDLKPILMACITGTLDASMVRFRSGTAACIVLASKGYPERSEKGILIQGLDAILDPDIQIFHAGTLRTDNGVVTNGGRVLGVTAYGKTIQEALVRAYRVIGNDGVHFNGMQYRHDIGGRAL